MVQIRTGRDLIYPRLGKKVLLADNISAAFNAIAAIPGDERSVLTAWVGALAYTMQIYFDFSGYSDMAIGLGKMFGFEFGKNFDYPYISKSVTEFWRGGIFHLDHGSEIMSISLWVETESQWDGMWPIFLLCGC